jgi:hypothetical protein
MRQAFGIDRFLPVESEMENVVGNSLFAITKGLAKLLLKPLQAVSFTVLAMFGAWPATVYLIYMAIDS